MGEIPVCHSLDVFGRESIRTIYIMDARQGNSGMTKEMHLGIMNGNVAGFASHPEIWDVKTETEKEEAHVLRFQIQGCGTKGI